VKPLTIMKLELMRKQAERVVPKGWTVEVDYKPFGIPSEPSLRGWFLVVRGPKRGLAARLPSYPKLGGLVEKMTRDLVSEIRHPKLGGKTVKWKIK
jgi:hypothetical protein